MHDKAYLCLSYPCKIKMEGGCKRPLYACILSLLFATPLFGQSRTVQQNIDAALARNYTRLFFDKQFEQIVEKMNPTMRERVKGIDGLSKFHADAVSTLGKELSVVSETTEMNSEGTVIYKHLAKYEGLQGGMAEIMWAFEGNGVITGFAIRPKRIEAESNYLDYQSKAPLRLPFDGLWMVFAGGKTLATNHHAVARNQRFALDMAIAEDGKTHTGNGKELTDYHVWNAKILAPAEGTVVTLVDGFPDNPIGATDQKNVAGNHLAIDHGNGEFSFLAHFQKGSFAVKTGDKVKAGQILGRVGNSGNTSEPHLHYHLQDGPVFPLAESMPAIFHGYEADGKFIEKGEPIQGQQIRNVQEPATR